MGSWNPPTDDDLSRLATLAVRSESRRYFFDRLDNPEWVAPLAEKNFFRTPPSAERADKPGYVSSPPWPEGRYLVRMAPLAAESVAAVLRQCGRSNNWTVTQHLLEAFGALPDVQVQRLAPKVVDWIGEPERVAIDNIDTAEYFADQAAGAIRRLLQASEVKQGINAIRTLLTPTYTTLAPNVDQVTARLSGWMYERAIETILPELVDKAGLKGVQVFSWRLTEALGMGGGGPEPAEFGALSCLSRPAIEDHGQNSDPGIRNILISAVRDAAVRYACTGEEELHQVVQDLENRSLLHRRIALHVLATASGGMTLASSHLTDRQLFDDYRMRHEFASLLRSRFGQLSHESQEELMGFVDQGPDLERYRRWYSDRPASSEQNEADYVGRWQRDWLSIVPDGLRGQSEDHYRGLVDRFGEADHPDFLTWTGTFRGENLTDSDEIAGMSSVAVIDYLRTRTLTDLPTRDEVNSMEGLCRSFGAMVKGNATEFSALARTVGSLAPPYAYQFLNALEGAAKEGAQISWEATIELCTIVVRHPFGHSHNGNWHESRRAVASLWRVGFSDGENRIPFRLRQSVWSVLDRLVQDPNDSTAGDVISDGRQLDPFTQSINTNRGLAMHGVFEYMLWCCRELKSEAVNLEVGLDLMPEVRAVIERHLDHEFERSTAVRAVYGESLPWLVHVDKSWVVEHLAYLFPADPDLAFLRQAVWGTYLKWCGTYDSVFPVLQAEYEAAVARMPSLEPSRWLPGERVDEKLGEHLVTFYWRGIAPWSLVDQFFEKGDDDVAGSTMEFVGKSLQNSDGDICAEILHRIRSLWESRLRVIEASDSGDGRERRRREAQSFAATFVSGKFDDEWSLASLDVALRIGHAPWNGKGVAHRLGQLAGDHPASATLLTLKLLKCTENPWDHHMFTDGARDVLEATSGSLNAETTENRREIVDHYVTRGQNSFRELL